MRSELLTVFAALSLALGGCVASSSSASSEGGDGPAPAQVAIPARAGAPTIAAIRTHDGVISIASSLGGPRVTIADADGNVTADALTLDELRAQAPEAYQLVTSSRAFLDASIERGVGERGARPEPDGAIRDFGGSRPFGR